MMTNSDIGNTLYLECKAFADAQGIDDVFQGGNIPSGEIKAERVVVLVSKTQPETYWKKTFVEVNIVVPDIAVNEANLVRLADLEKAAWDAFDEKVGQFGTSNYRFAIENIGREEDSQARCHYVNVKLLFEILNVT